MTMVRCAASVVMIVDNAIEVEINMGEDHQGGSETLVSLNDLLRPNFGIGLMALALHGIITHFDRTVGADVHWRRLAEDLMASIEINEIAVEKEIRAEGLWKDGGER